MKPHDAIKAIGDMLDGATPADRAQIEAWLRSRLGVRTAPPVAVPMPCPFPHAPAPQGLQPWPGIVGPQRPLGPYEVDPYRPQIICGGGEWARAESLTITAEYAGPWFPLDNGVRGLVGPGGAS